MYSIKCTRFSDCKAAPY